MELLDKLSKTVVAMHERTDSAYGIIKDITRRLKMINSDLEAIEKEMSIKTKVKRYTRKYRDKCKAKNELFGELEVATLFIFSRLTDLIHIINTRVPRIVHLQEVAQYRTLIDAITTALFLFGDDKNLAIGHVYAFLTASHLAGIERGVPVVPTTYEAYEWAKFDIASGFYDMAQEISLPFMTDELQRGEAAWSTDTDIIHPLAENARYIKMRADAKNAERSTVAQTKEVEKPAVDVDVSGNISNMLEMMLEMVESGNPLPDFDLDLLQSIMDKRPPPLLPASMMMPDEVLTDQDMEIIRNRLMPLAYRVFDYIQNKHADADDDVLAEERERLFQEIRVFVVNRDSTAYSRERFRFATQILRDGLRRVCHQEAREFAEYDHELTKLLSFLFPPEARDF